jgi:hypothetical protein
MSLILNLKNNIYQRNKKGSLLLEDAKITLSLLENHAKTIKRIPTDLNFDTLIGKDGRDQSDLSSSLSPLILKLGASLFKQENGVFAFIEPIKQAQSKHSSIWDSITQCLCFRTSIEKYTLDCEKSKINEIISSLRNLRLEAKTNPNRGVFLKIKELINELHSFFVLSIKKQNRLVRYLENISTTKVLLDLRKSLRCKMTSLYKCFSDSSDSEEESFTQMILSKIKFSNSLKEYYVQQDRDYQFN